MKNQNQSQNKFQRNLNLLLRQNQQINNNFRKREKQSTEKSNFISKNHLFTFISY
jgi:hypothetical protein